MITAIINKQASRALKNHFCWVYKNEIVSIEPCEDGKIIQILDEKENFLGLGYYNSKSTIALRVLSFKTEEINQDFFIERFQKALNARKPLEKVSNAYRIIHSEADFLPGLIVDWYNGYGSIQINTLGMEKFRDHILKAFISVCNPLGIIEKSDVKVRAKEGITTNNGVIYKSVPDEIIITENSIQFTVNLHEGQKTGFYLDQRLNRFRTSKYIEPNMNVLDVFCNAGGFGLYALQKGATVKFVDVSDHALTQVASNIALNHFQPSEIVKQDAFDFLTLERTTKKRYDCVLLDPPPFAKTKKEAEGAIKGFKFLFSAGLSLTNENGIIALFSCSHHINLDSLLQIAQETSSKAGIVLEVLETLHADKDHPYILNIPNSAYLSGIVVRKKII